MDYTSRQIPDDPEQQIVLAFENLGEILAEAGGGFTDLVDITTYHTSMADLALFSDVKMRYIVDDPFPAWTAIGVMELARPGLIVEIRAIAHVASHRSQPQGS
jgi:enamine deaminase RidA (YjgF/YER057c/UK114 family)